MSRAGPAARLPPPLSPQPPPCPGAPLPRREPGACPGAGNEARSPACPGKARGRPRGYARSQVGGTRQPRPWQRGAAARRGAGDTRPLGNTRLATGRGATRAAGPPPGLPAGERRGCSRAHGFSPRPPVGGPDARWDAPAMSISRPRAASPNQPAAAGSRWAGPSPPPGPGPGSGPGHPHLIFPAVQGTRSVRPRGSWSASPARRAAAG